MRASRLTARIDNNAVDDGFQIYLHSFVLSADGEWAVVQQGMNEEHAHSPAAITGIRPPVRDFTVRTAYGDRRRAAGEIRNSSIAAPGRRRMRCSTIARERPGTDSRRKCGRLEMPRTSRRRADDVNREAARRRAGARARAASCGTSHRCCSLEQLGPRTLQSLALIAEVVHGAPTRFEDPARFAFAHGGKDGHPFPVPLKVY